MPSCTLLGKVTDLGGRLRRFLLQRQMMEAEQQEYEELLQSETRVTEPAYRAWYYDPSGPVLSPKAAQVRRRFVCVWDIVGRSCR